MRLFSLLFCFFCLICQLVAGTAFQLRFTDDIAQICSRYVNSDWPVDCRIILEPAKGTLDLTKLPNYPAGTRFALLAAELNSPAERRVLLHASADWWFDCYVNNVLVYSTMGRGNGGAADKVRHAFSCNLRAGRNRIVFVVERGVDSMKFFCDIAETATPVRTAAPPAMERDLPLPPPEEPLKFHPAITHMTPESMLIRVVTTIPVALGAEAIFSGGERFTAPGDGVKRTCHTIELGHPAKRTQGSFRLFARDGKKYPGLTTSWPVRCFGGDGPAKILVFGDTQHSTLFRLDLLKKYSRLAEREETDFVIHLGDVDSTTDNFENRYFGAFLDPFARMFAGRSLMPVRGNHEFIGREKERWNDFFSSRKRKTFDTFRCGGIFFAVLDSGTQSPTAALAEEQRKMLAEALRSSAFRQADYRILVIHGADIAPENSPDKIGLTMRRILAPFQNGADFDLMIAGHVHRYRRIEPGRYPFPIVTLDGPGGIRENSALVVQSGRDGLTLRAFTPEGVEFDRFTIPGRRKFPGFGTE